MIVFKCGKYDFNGVEILCSWKFWSEIILYNVTCSKFGFFGNLPVDSSFEIMVGKNLPWKLMLLVIFRKNWRDFYDWCLKLGCEICAVLAMAFYHLSRSARNLRQLRHHHSTLSAADTYFHHSSRYSRHLFQVSINFHSKNQFYDDSNSFRSIGAYHRLLQYSSFSTDAPDEKRKQSKIFNSNECDRSWIDVYLPEKARPYARLARLDKPIGTWLLAWPCMW